MTRETYDLPRTQVESDRLNSQHIWLLDAMGGSAIEQTIQPHLPRNAKVLDVGTGTGVWLRELPSQYERSGCDLSSAQFPKASDDITFFEQNVLEPFDATHQGAYDLVHQRLLCLGLDRSTWPTALSNLLTVVKPGGWLQLLEINVQFRPLPGEEQPPIYKLGNKVMEIVCGLSNREVQVCEQLKPMLEHAGFEQVQERFIDCKAGKSAADERMAEISSTNLQNVFKGIYPGLKSKGALGALPEELRDEKAWQDFTDGLKTAMMQHGGQARIAVVVGRRPN